MTLNEIAWKLIKLYGLTKSAAFKAAANLIKAGAYDRAPEKVIEEVVKIGIEYVKKSQRKTEEEEELGEYEEEYYQPEDTPTDWMDEEGDINDGGDEDDTEDMESEFEELKDLVDDYLTTDKWEAEQSQKLLKDILGLGEETWGAAEAMRKIEAAFPDIKETVKSLILAVYHGSGYSRSEGKLDAYKEEINRLESALEVDSLEKWWI